MFRLKPVFSRLCCFMIPIMFMIDCDTKLIVGTYSHNHSTQCVKKNQLGGHNRSAVSDVRVISCSDDFDAK